MVQTHRPFRAGACRSWKKATSSAEDSPTSSQPANSVSMVPASDVVTMPSTKSV